MTPSTVFQALNNTPLDAQSGNEFVATAQVTLTGSDALVAFSASAWSNDPGEMSIELWMDGQPTGGRLAMYANTAAMHLSLGRSYVWLQSPTPGQHTFELFAGPTTVTDGNDIANLTVWEMGVGCAVLFSDDAACPEGQGETLIKEGIETMGNALLVSGSTSGWVSSAGQMVGAYIVTDGGDGLGMEVCANNPNQHLATVPADLSIQPPERGGHAIQINASGLTWTDGGDTVHLTVVEWVDPEQAPNILDMNPPLQDATANTQQGDGGTIAASSFASNGGTLLVRVGVSCWTQQLGEALYVGVQIDGTSLGFAQIWPNFTTTHMAMVPNDLVISNVPAGNHTLNLMAEANVITDQNDRVSVLIMEFPSA